MVNKVSIKGLEGLSNMSQPLAVAAKWLIIAGIAYTLASTGLFFVAGADQQTPKTAESAARQERPRPAVNIRSIVDRHLFGVADAPEKEAPEEQVAVVTRLPLELLAVLAADPDDETSKGSAIISQRGKGGLFYRVGEMVPGNAELVEVAGDHVVLSRAGSRERLNFPELKTQFVVEEDYDDDAGYDAEVDSQQYEEQYDSAAEAVDAYSEQIEQDPEGLLEDLGIEASDGNGYQVGSLAQAPYLRQTGLQPGDLILSVNGQPVGDIDADRALLTQVLEQGRARIEIQRGSRRFFVTTSLK